MSILFKNAGTLTPYGGPVLKKAVIVNSAAMSLGDAVQLSSGFAQGSATTGAIFGQVEAHSTQFGVGEISTGLAGAQIGSYAGTFTAASNNQTVNLDKVDVDVSKYSLWSNPTSGVIGTTTGSNLVGYYFQLSDLSTLNETTATTTTTNSQYFNWGTDPAVSTQVIVNIWKSVVFA